jgi:DNA-binding MarR family transcriptional regulator
MQTPEVGEAYRGVEGHSGYLLRQAWYAFRNAMDAALREEGLSGAQYAVLSVLARDPGMSGADLARVCNTTPQAMNGVLTTLEREALVARRAHPAHGRILQVFLTEEGRRRLDRATPRVRAVERSVEIDRTDAAMSVVKEWLVDTARRLDRTAPADASVSAAARGQSGGTTAV